MWAFLCSHFYTLCGHTYSYAVIGCCIFSAAYLLSSHDHQVAPNATMSIFSLFTYPTHIVDKGRKYTTPVLYASLYFFVASTTVSAKEVVTHPNNPASSPPCSTKFFNVAVIDSARQCQRFADTLPASLVYFTPQSRTQTLTFYQQQHPEMITHKTINHRTLLSKDNGRVKVIISPDKHGSQVDILVVKGSEL